MSTSPSSTSTSGLITTEGLLARLPPLPDVINPFFDAADLGAMPIVDADIEYLGDLISGRGLDYMFDEIVTALPNVQAVVGTSSERHVLLQARPSNTMNALTLPTADGALIVYNLGFSAVLSSVANAAALFAFATHDAGGSEAAADELAVTVEYIVDLIDWCTSLARGPRTPSIPLPRAAADLAVNIASRGQRFGMCHELAHVMAVRQGASAETRVAELDDGIGVDALRKGWVDEFEADIQGLHMYLEVLASRKQSPSSALIGAELMLNTGAMIRGDESDDDSHPPPDDRLGRVRRAFLETFGDQAVELSGPAMALRGALEFLRHSIDEKLVDRRARIRAVLADEFAAYEEASTTLSDDEKLAVARRVSRMLLESPGATLNYLKEELAGSRDELAAGTGSARQILALNAALHFDHPLRRAVGLKLPPP